MCRTISVLAVFMTLLIGCSSTEQSVLYDDLEQKDDAIYYQDALYTGTFIRKDSQQRVRAKGYLVAGQLQGEVVSYDIYARVIRTEHFKDGKPHGIFTQFYEDGTIEEQGQFEAGEVVGKWLLYYETGALARESFHKNDRPEGQWTYFNEDGTIKETRIYKNGQWIE